MLAFDADASLGMEKLEKQEVCLFRCVCSPFSSTLSSQRSREKGKGRRVDCERKTKVTGKRAREEKRRSFCFSFFFFLASMASRCFLEENFFDERLDKLFPLHNSPKEDSFFFFFLFPQVRVHAFCPRLISLSLRLTGARRLQAAIAPTRERGAREEKQRTPLRQFLLLFFCRRRQTSFFLFALSLSLSRSPARGLCRPHHVLSSSD